MTIIEDIGDYLEANGIGVVAETIWLNYFPDSPDTIVTITQTPGKVQSLRIDEIYPSFQFRVRGKTHEVAQSLINQIFNLMDNNNTRRIVASSGRVIIIRKLQPPFFLVSDDNDRANYVFNIDVLTRPD